MTGELSMSVFSPRLRSLFSNITINLLLIMEAFKSWVCFHFHRRRVTLFGYDTAQFRQCGIFIHNTEAVPVPPIEIKKKNTCWKNPSAVKVSKSLFIYFSPIQEYSCMFWSISVFSVYLWELCGYVSGQSGIKAISLFHGRYEKKHWCK